MIIIQIFILISISSAQRSCSAYDGYEYGCIYSSPSQCRWSSFSNTCQDVNAQDLGCNSNLNIKACQVQQFFGDLNRVYCIFNQQCVSAQYLNLYPCKTLASNLACQAISTPGAYCYWDYFKQQCNDFQECYLSQTEQDCLTNNQCIWDKIQNQCTLTKICSIYKDEISCTTDLNCFWSFSKCQLSFIIDKQSILNINDPYYLEILTRRVSINLCLEIQQYPVVHSIDAYEPVLNYYKLYLNSPLKQSQIKDIQNNLLNNFGCYIINNDRIPFILPNLQCDARGLNELGCQLINKIGEICFWQNNKCLRVNSFSEAEQITYYSRQNCNGSMNKYACLSIRYTEDESGCYWDEEKGQCKGLNPLKGISCLSLNSNELFSPSVCLLAIDTCYYNKLTYNCNPMCRDSIILNDQQKCESSNFNCTYDLVDTLTNSIECRFKTRGVSLLCGYLGQNFIECMNVKQTCQFFKGICQPVTTQQLMYLNCEDNLNKFACARVTNPSQTCIWNDITKKCLFSTVNKDVCVQVDRIVNPVFCRLITQDNQPCTYNAETQSCQISNLETTQCITADINKQTCLGITQKNQYCKWSKDSLKCQNTQINTNTKCQDLQEVNAQSCQQVIGYPYCIYNQNNFSCDTVSNTDGLTCDTPGISLYTCMELKGQSCIWRDGRCTSISVTQVQQLPCSSLILVSEKTCAMVTLNREGCKFVKQDSTNIIYPRCTNVQSQDTCSILGLNSYGCASRDPYECYFDFDTYQCKDVQKDPKTQSYPNLFCSSSFPTKNVCLLISQTGQFCKWNKFKKQCEDVTFSASDICAGFQNQQQYNSNTCLGLQGIPGTIQSNQICVSNEKNCLEAIQYYSSLNVPITQFQDCGSDQKVNIHACAYFSNPNLRCYFDNYQCTKLEDSQLLNTLQCKQANKATCLKIKTPNQLCVWSILKKQCYSITVTSNSDCIVDFSAHDNLYGQNVCASIKQNKPCEYDSLNFQCVQTLDIPRKCNYPGLNKYSCVQKTYENEACYYDSKRNICVDITTEDVAFQIHDCSAGNVNKGGCLAIKGIACQWQNFNCVELTMTGEETCDSFNTMLINPYTCANIKSSDKCLYDPLKNVCSTTESVSDCYFGYNYAACMTNPDCYFEDSTKMCKYKKLEGTCAKYLTSEDCIGTTVDTCYWYQQQCVQVKVDSNSKCSDFIKGSYNALTCSSVILEGQYCQLIGGICVDVLTSNLFCDDIGLNQAACLFKTYSNCLFDRNRCDYAPDLSMIGCDSRLSKYACQNVVKQNNFCQFTNVCDYALSAEQIQTAKCSDFTDYTKSVVYNKLLCQSITKESCFYFPNLNQCKSYDGFVADCSKAQSQFFNEYACLHNTATPCQWDQNKMLCYDMIEIDQITCETATTYGQCISVTKINEICQWNENQCQKVNIENVQNDCSYSIQHVNINYCMAMNGAIKCRWQINEGTSQGECYQVTSTQSPCYGLNYQACIDSSQTNACYFKISTKQCLEVKGDVAYNVKCSELFTKKSCLASQFTPCSWEDYGEGCIQVNMIDSDNCLTYNNKNINPQTCSRVKGVNSQCYYDSQSYKCNQTIKDNYDCSVLGLSELSCMSETKGFQCLFDDNSFRCIEVNNFEQVYKCTDKLSHETCINFDVSGQSCKWDIQNNVCQFVNLDQNRDCQFYKSTDEYEYSPQTCAQINNYGTKCIHTGKGCDYIYKGAGKVCETPGLNKQACKDSTIGECVFKNYKCQNATLLEECSDFMNKNACIKQKKNCCRWDGDTCVTQTYTYSCDSDISQKCCEQIITGGQACFFDTTCKQAENSIQDCTQGNNELSCRGFTQGFCKWDMSCVKIPNEQIIDMVCSDKLNKYACLNVDVSKGYCQYNDLTKACSSVEVTDITSCESLTLISSYNLCTLIKGETCKYDAQSLSCTSIVDVTKEQYDSPGLNEYTCKLLYSFAIWDNSKCQPIQFPLIFCSSQLNRGACTQVDNKKANCRYQEQCETFTFDPLTTQCGDLKFINNPSLCQQIINEPCYYDQSTLSCAVVTKSSLINKCNTPDNLQPNELACRRIHDSLSNYQCEWKDGKCVENTIEITQCEDYTGYYQCLDERSRFCHWDLITEKCSTVIGYSDTVKTSCIELPAQVSRKVCFYFAKDNCGWDTQTYNCVMQPPPFAVEAAYSVAACMEFTQQDCFFNQDDLKCQKLEQSDFDLYTCGQLKYSSNSVCLRNTCEGQFCKFSQGFCSIADLNNVLCEDNISIRSCEMIKTPGIKCKWSSVSNKCITADINSNCAENLNALACVNVQGQNCQWLGQTCVIFQGKHTTLEGQSYSLPGDNELLVSPKVCQQIYDPQDQQTIPMIWDTQYYRCLQFDPNKNLEVTCETLGLNKYGCTSLINYKCGWNVDQKFCYSFIQLDEKKTCSEYTFVSPKVCASITTNGLSCSYNIDNFSCQIVNQDSTEQCETLGANKQACLKFSLSPCLWDSILEQCSTYMIYPGVTSCINKKPASQFLNAVSCQQIDFGFETCKFNSNTMQCTTDLSEGDDCNTPGLNKVSCTRISKEGSKCKFENGACRDLTDNDYNNIYSCRDLKTVNANACRMYDFNLACKFSEVQMSCVSVSKFDTCNHIGLNRFGCNFISQSSNCLWNSEFNKCVCITSQIDCTASISKEKCDLSSDCFWDSQKCRRKLCEDIDSSKCTGSNINGYACYLNKKQICLGAESCEQISELSTVYQKGCDDLIINNKQCRFDLNNIGRCMTESCQTLNQNQCEKGLIEQKCIYDSYYGKCRPKVCEDILANQECSGNIINNVSCLFDRSFYKCLSINSCEQIMNMRFDSDIQKSQACEKLQANGMQCQWKTLSQFTTTMTCTNNKCNIMGDSNSTCNGAEIDNQVCVYKSQICLPCEFIKDSCICQQYNDYCSFQDGVCKSYQCSNIKTQIDCLSINYNSRCTWLQTQNMCVVKCLKLNQIQCNERQTSCYWDSNLKFCTDGQMKTIILDPIFVVSDLTDSQIWGGLINPLFISAILMNLLI